MTDRDTPSAKTFIGLRAFLENGCDARPEDRHHALQDLDQLERELAEMTSSVLKRTCSCGAPANYCRDCANGDLRAALSSTRDSDRFRCTNGNRCEAEAHGGSACPDGQCKNRGIVPTTGERTLDKDVVDYLTADCSRLMHGQCSTLRCLRRGGYKDGPYEPEIATCEAYEVMQMIRATPSTLATTSGLYVASRVKQAEVWKAYRAKGWKINASWIDEAGEGETADFGELWARIGDEIARSRCLVFYAAGVEDFPFKGALVEVGMALAMGKPVLAAIENVMVEGRTMCPVGSWLIDRRVQRFDTLGEAMDAARSIASAIEEPKT